MPILALTSGVSYYWCRHFDFYIMPLSVVSAVAVAVLHKIGFAATGVKAGKLSWLLHLYLDVDEIVIFAIFCY